MQLHTAPINRSDSRWLSQLGILLPAGLSTAYGMNYLVNLIPALL